MKDRSENSNKPWPLEGIRVLEYGVFHAGPGGSAILGDLGADVIKIEAANGDPERYWTKVGKLDMTMPSGESFMFDTSNRNKKGICLDIKQEKGRRVFEDLVKKTDVFVTNLRKSTKIKLGLDYETLKKLNPKLIHANVSGYGPEGPMSDLGAFDPLGLARSGMMFVTGAEEPRLIHLGVLDQTTAIALSHAIITALFVRDRRGVGQELHVSLYSTAIWMLHCNLMLTNALAQDPTKAGDRSKHSPLRNCFLCKDGLWVISTHHPEEKYWDTFCRAAGREDLINDPRFADDAGREKNCPELVALFDQVFLEKTRDEWMEIFRVNGLMFSPVHLMEEVQNDPQALINNYIISQKHPVLGEINVPGYPVHFSECQAGIRHFAPDLGADTDLVLQEMGYSDQEIGELKKQGVVK